MSSREFEFEQNTKCDECGTLGAWDIYGDYFCSACIEKFQKSVNSQADGICDTGDYFEFGNEDS